MLTHRQAADAATPSGAIGLISALALLAAFRPPGKVGPRLRSTPPLQALALILSGLFCLLAVATHVLGLVPRTFAAVEASPAPSEQPTPIPLTILFHKMERAPNHPF